MSTTKHRRSVSLAQEQWDNLVRFAKAEDRSVNSVIRRLVDQHIPQAVPPVAVPASPPAPTTPEDGGVVKDSE